MIFQIAEQRKFDYRNQRFLISLFLQSDYYINIGYETKAASYPPRGGADSVAVIFLTYLRI